MRGALPIVEEARLHTPSPTRDHGFTWSRQDGCVAGRGAPLVYGERLAPIDVFVSPGPPIVKRRAIFARCFAFHRQHFATNDNAVAHSGRRLRSMGGRA
jgi:hypothetical protein